MNSCKLVRRSRMNPVERRYLIVSALADRVWREHGTRLYPDAQRPTEVRYLANFK